VPPPMPYQQRETPGEAVAALVLGIVSIAICPFIGWLPGGIALYLGTKAKRKADAYPAQVDGRGLALAGQITGAVGIAFGVLIDAFYVFIIILAIGSSSSTAG
jgi:hypothetical protein